MTLWKLPPDRDSPSGEGGGNVEHDHKEEQTDAMPHEQSEHHQDGEGEHGTADGDHGGEHEGCHHDDFNGNGAPDGLLNVFNWKGLLGSEGFHTTQEENLPSFWRCSGVPGSTAMGEVNLTMAFNTFLVIGILVPLFIRGGKRLQEIPGRIQAAAESWVEMLIGFFQSFAGEHVGRKYVGLLGAYFTFILALNLWGLIPGFHSPTANINTTLGFSVIAIIASLVIGLKESGVRHIVHHWMGEPDPRDGMAKGIGAFLLLPLELIAQFARMVSLALRLYGNIFGGDVVIAVFVVLLTDLAVSIYLPLPLHLPVVLLHLIASVIQAVVFTALLSVYIAGFCSHHGDDHTSHAESVAH
ncbi:F0F1 ATP synthase subunit A [bacterium]|nr:F0F1 ATP synthase subunit A [bacterium]